MRAVITYVCNSACSSQSLPATMLDVRPPSFNKSGARCAVHFWQAICNKSDVRPLLPSLTLRSLSMATNRAVTNSTPAFIFSLLAYLIKLSNRHTETEPARTIISYIVHLLLITPIHPQNVQRQINNTSLHQERPIVYFFFFQV